jgi:hypothetical protein
LVALLVGMMATPSCQDPAASTPELDGSAEVSQEIYARDMMVAYAMEVLVPLSDGAVQVDEATVELRGVRYAVHDTAGFARFYRQVFFEIGNAALRRVDALGVDPFQLWPLCGVATSWMMDQIDLSMVASEGSPLDTLVAADLLPDATRALLDTVEAELAREDDAARTPPAERVDPVRCAQAEAEERERRGWPALD